MSDFQVHRFSRLGKVFPSVFIYAVLCGTGLLSATEAAPAGEFVDHVYRDDRGDHKYVVFVPAGYTPDRQWPIILWLHGASSRGTDGRSTLVAGIGPNIHFRRATCPFLVVFPQCENLRSRLLGGWTDEREEAERALKILAAVEQEYRVDPQRRTLAGVSMGAFGAWSIAARTPHHWSAMVPISGGGPLSLADSLTKIPVWAFHAVDDQVVPVSASQSLVDAINDRGGRAFCSVLPNGGHNIGSRVFAQDDLYAWLLDPSHEPQQQLTWSLPLTTTSDLQHEVPFVPGAEVENAVLVHLGRDVLEAASLGLPAQVPANSLQGSHGGQSASAGGGLMRFQVTVAGVQYAGELRQAHLQPLPDNQFRLQLGIQPLTMTVLGTEVQGRILRAQAGPMQVVIGSQRPSWLSVVVRPRVSERRLRLELVSAEFPIDQDNWYVTEPSGVTVWPVPILRGTISQRLTDGLYAKKGDIEQQVVAGVPRLLEQIEERVDAQLKRTITFGRWPMPVWQPRARFWLSDVAVDQDGLTVSLGTTLAALAPQVDKVELKRHAGPAEKPALQSRGVEIAVADSVIDAWTELLATSEVRYFHAVDFQIKPFRRLSERDFLEQAIPSLAQQHAHSELQSVISFEQPMHMSPVEEDGKSTPLSETASTFRVQVPEMRLTVSVRNSTSGPWERVAEFPFSWRQDFQLELLTPSHRRRTVRLEALQPAEVQVDSRMLQKSQTGQPNPELIAEQFRRGMEETISKVAATATKLKELVLESIPFVCEEIAWKGNYVTLRLEPLSLQLRNQSADPLTYEVGIPGGNWSQPYTLAPGMMHEFPALRPLTWRSGPPDRELRYTLPVGSVILYRGGEEPVVIAAEEPPEAEAAAPDAPLR